MDNTEELDRATIILPIGMCFETLTKVLPVSSSLTIFGCGQNANELVNLAFLAQTTCTV